MTPLVVGAVAAVVAALSLAVLRPLLVRQALDLPNVRSSHSVPVPRGGGLGVVAGALGGAVTAYALEAEPSAVVLVVLVVMAVVGLVEDLRGVPIALRLLAQVGVAVVVVTSLDGLGPVWVLPVLVVALAGWCNGFNFMDGINGISGFTALVVLGWYAGLASGFPGDAAVVTAVLLAGAVLGFLPWNLPRARLFLGDSGSYALGMALPTLGLVLRSDGATWLAVVAPLLVYGADVGWTLVDRIRRGETWHEAHRDHVYQAVSLRLGHAPTALLVAGFTATSCLLCAWLEDAPVALVGAWVVLLAVYLSLPKAFARSAA